MADITDYSNLISGAHRQQPDFNAVVSTMVRPWVDVINTADKLYSYFDVATATGQQLDILGQWVGASRIVDFLVTDPTFYLDWDSPTKTFDDQYIWGDPGGFVSPTSLPDVVYRSYIYARIANNVFKGNIQSIANIIALIYPNNVVYIDDNQDMTAIVFVGGVVDPLLRLLVTNGFLDVRPFGVQITYVFNQIVFSWDQPATVYQAGWDQGIFFT